MQAFSHDDGDRLTRLQEGPAVRRDRPHQLVAPPSTTYAHDQANRLTRAARPATTFTAGFDRAYAYDGDGLRADLLWDASGGLPLVLGDASGLYVPGADGLPLERVSLTGRGALSATISSAALGC